MGKVKHAPATSQDNRLSSREWISTNTHLDSQGNILELSRSATLVVAASDSSAKSKAGADYVCGDETYTNDDEYIQAAIDALPADGGKVILLEGTFTLTDELHPTENTVLEGRGRSTVITIANETNSNNIIATSPTTEQNGVIIRCLKIDGNKANQSSNLDSAIHMRTGFGIVEYVYIVDCYDRGIHIENFQKNIVRNCEVVDCDGFGIDIHASTLIICEGNSVSGSGSIGIYAHSGTGGRIINNTVLTSTSYGIRVDTTATKLIVGGNYVDSGSERGILVNDCDNTVVSNNIVSRNGGNGIEIQDNGIVCVGNDCVLNDGCGIRGRNLSYSTIVGNTCEDNNQAEGSNTGIYLDNTSQYNTIVGNTCIDTQDSATQKYGIHEVSGDYNVIIGNTCYGNTTGGVLITGSNTVVRDNIGYITENSGTDAIASGQTTKAVAHGLAATPTIINIAFREQGDNDFGRWWVSTIGATNFTLNVSADPGASNLDFAWEAKVR